MPILPTYPGVYVEEIPSGVRAISGVNTSVTAFIGFLKRGPLNHAVRVLSFGDFERGFGGLDTESEVSYAVQQFFLNGGGEAWIVRTAADDPAAAGTDPQTSSRTLQNEDDEDLLVARAANPGRWGDRLEIDLDHDASADPPLFNLTVTEFVAQNGSTVAAASETFRNLSMDPSSAAYALDVVNDGSKLLRLTSTGTAHTAATKRPAQTGTKSGKDVSGLTLNALDAMIAVDARIGGNSIFDAVPTFKLKTDASGTTPSRFRASLQAAIRTIDRLNQATVDLIDNRLRIRAGIPDAGAIVSFPDDGGVADAFGLSSAGSAAAGVQRYSLAGGTDGRPPTAVELAGRAADKSGMYALEDVDLFNILCIPRMAKLAATPASSLISEATNYCERRRAFLIVDIPEGANTVEEMEAWITDSSTPRHKNTATYFPRLMVADPLSGFRLKPRPASGAMAGLYARTDGERGVWKAPAGVEAALRGTQALEYKLTDAENGVLNPLGVNALRTFRDSGNVSWGARTMDGSDQRASEWKYVPVRRTALFIEESLYRGTQWVVFEPNDESLWAQIRLNVGSFMQRLFQQGAFQGSAPRDAFFVKCDSETTTQDHIDRGIINISVGFAPLKPAEFVILRIQQITSRET